MLVIVIKEKPIQKTFKTSTTYLPHCSSNLMCLPAPPQYPHKYETPFILHAFVHASLDLPFPFLHLWKKFLISVLAQLQFHLPREAFSNSSTRISHLKRSRHIFLPLVNNFFFLLFFFHLMFIHPTPLRARTSLTYICIPSCYLTKCIEESKGKRDGE